MKTPETIDVGFDPRRFQGPKECQLLPASSPGERIELTRHVMQDLATFPPAPSKAYLAQTHRVWERIRALPVRPDGVTVEQVLARDAGVPLIELERLIVWLRGAEERQQQALRDAEILAPVAAAFAAFKSAAVAAGGAR